MRIRLVALALVSVLGCSDAASPGDLAVVVATNEATMRAGERVTVTVTALNTGSHAITVVANGCPRPFDVYDSAGNRVALDELCNSDLRTATLEPGGSYSFALSWTGEKVRYSGGAMVREAVPSGSYTLRGAVKTIDFGVIEAGLANVYVLP